MKRSYKYTYITNSYVNFTDHHPISLLCTLTYTILYSYVTHDNNTWKSESSKQGKLVTFIKYLSLSPIHTHTPTHTHTQAQHQQHTSQTSKSKI